LITNGTAYSLDQKRGAVKVHKLYSGETLQRWTRKRAG
jgi:hypothetical protein